MERAGGAEGVGRACGGAGGARGQRGGLWEGGGGGEERAREREAERVSPDPAEYEAVSCAMDAELAETPPCEAVV